MDLAKIWLTKSWLIYLLAGLLGYLTLCLYFLAVAQFLPQTINFTYTSPTVCTSSPQLLPGLLTSPSNPNFKLSAAGVLSLGKLPLFASKICVQAVRPPSANSMANQKLTLRGIALSKKVSIRTAAYPQLAAHTSNKQPIKLSRPLQLQLTTNDAVFAYAVVTNGISASCNIREGIVLCNLQPLKLNYGSTYRLRVERLYGNHVVGTVLDQTFQTISATAVTGTSINAGSTVQDSPQLITLTTNKVLRSIGSVSVTAKEADGTTKIVPATATFNKQNVAIKFASALPRKAAITIHLSSLIASDSSGLEQPYDLVFNTSGGPKVVSLSTGSYDVLPSQSITLTFDQPINSHQDPSTYLTLLINGTTQVVKPTLGGSSITFAAPAGGYPLCSTITMQLSNAVQNQYGITGDSGWSKSVLARCYSNFSFGSSVQGRAITAYKFGSGASVLLYIAAMHGDENNTANLLQKWVNDLNANPQLVTANHTVIVVPQINPDGVAAHSRLNARSIDLNRNFPSNSWQTTVTEPNGAAMPAGGPSPLSEPESQSLASYIQTVKPRLVLTYHSHAGIVEANDAGDSIDLAAKYAAKAGYRAVPTYAIGSTFDYSTSGAMEDWMNDKLNLPAFVIELTSSTADEFSKNQSAMRAMLQI